MHQLHHPSQRTLQKRRFWLAYLSLMLICILLLSNCAQTPVSPTLVPAHGTATVIARQTNEPLPTDIPAPFPIPTPLSSKPSMGNSVRRWLRGEPCFAPCWEGITLGKSTAPEAAERLNQSPIVKQISFYPDSDPLAIVDILELDMEETSATVAFERNPPYRVLSIIMGIGDGYHLGEIISVYGEPTHVYALVSRSPRLPDLPPSHYIMIVDLKHGFLIHVYGLESAQAMLDSEEHIDGTMTFFEPSEQGFRALQDFTRNIPAYSELVPWQGYQSFEYYCQQAPVCQQELVP